MNRRKFFKWLGAGVAAVVVAPTTLFKEESVCVAPAGYRTYVMGKDAFIAGYADYSNFSEFADSAAIDEAVSNAAKELGARAGHDSVLS